MLFQIINSDVRLATDIWSLKLVLSNVMLSVFQVIIPNGLCGLKDSLEVIYVFPLLKNYILVDFFEFFYKSLSLGLVIY